MNRTNVAEHQGPESGFADDARDWIGKLRAHLATRAQDAETTGALSGLSSAVERTLTEHEGMVSELLCVYEQLGVVFEVTRKLSSVREETEVVDLFLRSLRGSFARHEVFVAQPTGREGWSANGSDLAGTAWLEALLDRARSEGRVLVERPPQATMPERIAEVMAGPVMSGDSFVCAIVLTRREAVPEFVASDMLLLESLTKFCGDLIRNYRLVSELREMSFALVRSLVSAVDQKDEYTSGHSLRVGYFAMLLGRALGLDREALRMLQWSALLHDVGKIGIRDEVLKKPGKLTPEEFDHIKEHPVRSFKVVRDVPQLAGALDGILHHHEHYDGSGYPSGLVGEAIPLQARIIQVADVFDALTSTRAYRRAYDWAKALDVLQEEAGTTVDPQMQKLFDGLIRKAVEGRPGAWERLLRTAERPGAPGEEWRIANGEE